jgi:hypothetical protein
MDARQVSYLQQALWKLEAAKKLACMALGEEQGQYYMIVLERVMEEIESEIAESCQ